MLNLSGNHIQQLPKGIFDKLTKLTAIGLNDNNLTEIDDMLVANNDKLQWLSLSGNNIGDKPKWIFELQIKGVNVSF